ncbi:MAG TPA: molybdopterin-dependent oxidoreductase [Acidimicrobiia bacterium]
MPNLPPGQIETKRFPVVGEREPSSDIADWSLTIEGLVPEDRVLGWEEYLALQHRNLTFDVHCVTSWTRFDTTFTGVPLAELVDPLPESRFVSFTAYSERRHHTSLPIHYALEHSWVVHQVGGEPLAREHGGPVRVVTPGKYFYKSIKWLKTITLLGEDRLGWWETNSSYHNNADPMAGDQRFTTGSLRPEQLERFLEASGYDKYRGRVMIGLDLTRWRPASLDLRRLYLKNCDLAGIDLSRADLRESNLSLSNLRGAGLAGVDLSGSDLEGVDFSDADLRDADLSGSALSAARFDGAKVDGARFEHVWGLVESSALYLQSQGVSLDL